MSLEDLCVQPPVQPQASSLSEHTDCQTHTASKANLGALLHKEGLNVTEAESWYVSVLRSTPNDTCTILNYVELLNGRGEHGKALQLVERLFNTLDHLNHSLSSALGSASFLEEAPPSDAGALALSCVQLSSLPDGAAPVVLDAYRCLADTLQRANASQDAEDAYGHILSEFPCDLMAVEGLAGLLAARGEYAQGRECYLHALSNISAHLSACKHQEFTAALWIEHEACVRAAFGVYLWQWCGDGAEAMSQVSRALASDSCSRRARQAMVAIVTDWGLDTAQDATTPGGQELDKAQEQRKLRAVNKAYQDALDGLRQKSTCEAAGRLEEARLRSEWVSHDS